MHTVKRNSTPNKSIPFCEYIDIDLSIPLVWKDKSVRQIFQNISEDFNNTFLPRSSVESVTEASSSSQATL